MSDTHPAPPATPREPEPVAPPATVVDLDGTPEELIANLEEAYAALVQSRPMLGSEPWESDKRRYNEARAALLSLIERQGDEAAEKLQLLWGALREIRNIHPSNHTNPRGFGSCPLCAVLSAVGLPHSDPCQFPGPKL